MEKKIHLSKEESEQLLKQMKAQKLIFDFIGLVLALLYLMGLAIVSVWGAWALIKGIKALLGLF